MPWGECDREAEKQRLFEATRAARVPMVLSDPDLPDNPIVCANQAFLDMTGYPADEIVGRNCRFLQGPGTDPGSVAALRDAIRERRPVLVELLNYRRDGTPFLNAILVGPMFGSDGRLLLMFANQLDISDRATHAGGEGDAARERFAALTPRERQIFASLAAGRMNKQIAFDLGLSQRTVEFYRANVMRKLGARSLPEAMRLGFAAGMI